jgi:hypothetical protein
VSLFLALAAEESNRAAVEIFIFVWYASKK